MAAKYTNSGIGYDMAFDADGDIIGVVGNSLVRMDPVTGIHSVISTGGFLFSRVTGVTLHPGGDIYVSLEDPADARIARINPITGEQTKIFLSPFIALRPEGIGVHPSGDLLVIYSYGKQIMRVDPLTGTNTIFSYGGRSSRDIAVTATGDIFVTDFGSKYGAPTKLIKIDPDTAAFDTILSGGELEQLGRLSGVASVP